MDHFLCPGTVRWIITLNREAKYSFSGKNNSAKWRQPTPTRYWRYIAAERLRRWIVETSENLVAYFYGNFFLIWPNFVNFPFAVYFHNSNTYKVGKYQLNNSKKWKVVIVLAVYSNNSSSNPAEVKCFYSVNCLIRTKLGKQHEKIFFTNIRVHPY